MEKPKTRQKPRYVNIRISGSAYRALSRRAKKDRRSILSVVDVLMEV